MMKNISTLMGKKKIFLPYRSFLFLLVVIEGIQSHAQL